MILNNQNVLNNYRSFNYIFTLAGILNKDINSNDPAVFEENIKKFTILRSGGKSVDSIVADNSESKQIVESFNQQSFGRYNFFIDNVNITSTFIFTSQGGLSLPTSFSFEITETYGINGFLETLQVIALAIGNINYAQTKFILKLEFIGYPATEEIIDSKPEIVPESTRYFVIIINKVNAELSEKGTKYTCSAVPYSDRVFGNSNILKVPISSSGYTVKEILNNFVDNINNQLLEANKSNSDSSGVVDSDKYEILFPSVNEDNTFNFDQENEIAESKLYDLSLKENAVYKFVNIGEESQIKDQTSTSYTPATSSTKPIVQFAQNQRINDCITAIIRDSSYVNDILKKIGQKDTPDEFGFINYFLIQTQIEELKIFNNQTKKFFQKIKYIIVPSKIHISSLPNFNSYSIKYEKLKNKAVRNYNYLYTGQNTDVLNFNLTFNNLFFEALPYAMGNSDSVPSNNSLGRNAEVFVYQDEFSKAELEKKSSIDVPIQVVPQDINPREGINASQIKDDPYYILSRNLHDAIINSKINLINGNLKILGDPYYVVAGNLGGYYGLNSAIPSKEQVLISINFRNPADIDNNTGLIVFNNKKNNFNGIYRINFVDSVFNNGLFVQNLQILRIPGQILEDEISETDPTQIIKSRPNPLTEVIDDTTPSQGVRAEGINLALATGGRTLPNPVTNFTAAPGGLGGIQNVASQIFDSVQGIATIGNDILTSLGSGNIDQLTSGIRLKVSGLINDTKNGLSNASIINQAGNTLNGSFAIQNSDNKISTTLSSDNLLDVGKKALGSIKDGAENIANGIGDKLNSLKSSLNDPSAMLTKFGVDPAKLSGLGGNLQSKITDQIKGLSDLIPKEVDLKKLPGLALDTIPKDKLTNIPATPEDSVAPPPSVDTAFIKNLLASGDSNSLAKAFGVSNVSQIPGEIAETISEKIDDFKGKFSDITSSISNLSNVPNALSDKLNSVNKQINSITGNITSVETNLKSLGQMPSSSVLEKFGTKSSSPLDKLVNKLNDPNAPLYTGNDPIVRARLGLPPNE